MRYAVAHIDIDGNLRLYIRRANDAVDAIIESVKACLPDDDKDTAEWLHSLSGCSFSEVEEAFANNDQNIAVLPID